MIFILLAIWETLFLSLIFPVLTQDILSRPRPAATVRVQVAKINL